MVSVQRDVLLAVIGSAALLAALFSPAFKTTPPLTPVEVIRTGEEGGEGAASGPIFRDRTEAVGLLWTHSQGGNHLEGLDESFGSGLCVFDADGDGFEDIFLVGGSGQNRFYQEREWWTASGGSALFLNDQGRGFLNATDRLPVEPNLWGFSCAAADLDGDGDQDLVIGALRDDRIYENVGGRFEARPGPGGGDAGWTNGFVIADLNADGLPDIYELGFIAFNKGARVFEGEASFEGQARGRFDPSLFDSRPNRLHLNEGGLTFRTEDAGALSDNSGRGMFALLRDLNGDGASDLFIANGPGSPDAELFGVKGGGLERRGGGFGLSRVQGSSGGALADLDSDGSPELILGGTAVAAARIFSWQEDEKQFTDASDRFGIRIDQLAGFASNTVLAGDVDLDGGADLLFLNGLMTPDRHADRVTQGQPDLLFKSTSGRALALAEEPALARALSSRSAALFDADRDGDLDLVLTENNGAVRYLENTTDPEVLWVGFTFSDAKEAALETAEGLVPLTIPLGTTFLGTSPKQLIVSVAGEGPLSLVVDGERWPIDSLRRHYQVTSSGLVLLPERAAVPALGDGYEALVTEALADPMPEVRAAALEALANDQSPASLAGIFAALDDPSADVRVQAVALLTSLEMERSVPALLGLLDGGTSADRCAVAEAFRVFFREEEAVLLRKGQSVSTLIRSLEDSDSASVACLAGALAEAERIEAVMPMTAVFDDRSDLRDPARSALLASIGAIRDPASLPFLERVARTTSYTDAVRARALASLAQIYGADVGAALPTFQNFLDQDPEGLVAALQAMIPDDDMNVHVRPELIRVLTRDLRTTAPDEEDGIEAIEAAWRRDQAAALARLDAARVQSPTLSRLSTYAVTRRYEPEMPPEVAEALAGDNEETRQAAMRVLVARSEPWAYRALRLALADGDQPFAQSDARWALGEGGALRHAPLLRDLAALRHVESSDLALRRLVVLGAGDAASLSFYTRIAANPEERPAARASAMRGLIEAARREEGAASEGASGGASR